MNCPFAQKTSKTAALYPQFVPPAVIRTRLGLGFDPVAGSRILATRFNANP